MPELPAEALEPSGPPARWYMSPAPAAPIDADRTRREIADGIVRMASETGVAAPIRDGRLDQVADDLARTRPQRHMPSFELVAFLLSHYGIVEPEPRMNYGQTRPGYAGLFLESVRPLVTPILRDAPRTRLGVGLAVVDGELHVALAVQAQRLELRPVPRTLDLGLVAHIEGQLYGGHRQPRVIVTLPDGTVDELNVRGVGPRFQTSLGCRYDRKGIMQVEIAADTDRGPTVLGNFPIFCAVDPPRSSPALKLDTRGSADPQVVEDELFALINGDRARRGLGLVRRERRLSEVARAHSRKMAESGIVGHVLPGEGNIGSRLRRARIDVSLASENVGQDYSAAGAQRGFMSSPGHRDNIIDPRMTTVGIGVAPGRRDQSGLIPLFVTQIFAAGLN